VAIPAVDLNDMTSLDLAVLITARHRTVRQALKAASLLADRHEWHHFEECADMLCRSYEPAEQLLGLHLIRRYLTDPRMRHDFSWPLRYLARSENGNVASLAQRTIEDLAEAD
jgi:hypothetical protein